MDDPGLAREKGAVARGGLPKQPGQRRGECQARALDPAAAELGLFGSQCAGSHLQESRRLVRRDLEGRLLLPGLPQAVRCGGADGGALLGAALGRGEEEGHEGDAEEGPAGGGEEEVKAGATTAQAAAGHRKQPGAGTDVGPVPEKSGHVLIAGLEGSKQGWPGRASRADALAPGGLGHLGRRAPAGHASRADARTRRSVGHMGLRAAAGRAARAGAVGRGVLGLVGIAAAAGHGTVAAAAAVAGLAACDAVWKQDAHPTALRLQALLGLLFPRAGGSATAAPARQRGAGATRPGSGGTTRADAVAEPWRGPPISGCHSAGRIIHSRARACPAEFPWCRRHTRGSVVTAAARCASAGLGSRRC
mmetsp:Transcript_12112/g.37502  ORF Transcript_12112/g.37502 Transcript_12112/m.37502 type:complete len:363 (+) Transcript_12112:492-1580(+)